MATTTKPIQGSYTFPRFFNTKYSEQAPEELKGVFRDLVRELEKMHREQTRITNLNFTAIKTVAQDSAPTVPSGEIWLWEDTDATSTNPTHYLIANDGTNTVTFASEEVVP